MVLEVKSYVLVVKYKNRYACEILEEDLEWQKQWTKKKKKIGNHC